MYRLAQMEQDILRREEEMFNAASSTRCMSCGQLPADPTNAFVNHTAARRSAGPSPSTISGASTAVHPSSARDRHHHNNSARGGQQGQTHVAGGGAGGGAGGSGNQHSRNIQIPSGTAGFLRGVAASTVRPKTSPNAELSAQFRSQFSISNPSLQSLEPPQRDASVGDFDSSSQANIASFTAPDGVPRGGVSDGVTGGPLDDELSLHSEHSHNNMFLLPQEGSQTSGSSLLHSSNNGGGYGGGDPSQVLGPVRSEEIYQVITGSAGLKALMPQHTPMVPVRDPYGITAAHQQQHQTAGQGQGQGQGQSKRRQQQQVKVPEPMYRKAKLAAHLKEMVKVSAPSAQNYGYNSNNPFFVVEGYSEEGDPHQQNLSSSLDGGSSLHSSSRQGGKGARPRTQGSNPATSVYVPIPRSSGQPHSVTQQLLLSASTSALGNGEHTGVGTILPYITTSNSNKIPQQQEADFVLKANTSKLNSYV